MASIYIESRPATPALWDHLYIVYKNDAGEEYIIRGSPQDDVEGFGVITIQANILLSLSKDARGADDPITDRGQVELDLGGRSAEDVWNLMLQQAGNIEDMGISYDPLEANSNSVVASVLHAVGFDVENDFPYPSNTSAAAVPAEGNVFGFGRVLQGTANADTIVGYNHIDALSGGAGSDHLYGLDGNDTIKGGAGADFLEGGDGDDVYVMRHGETGIDEITDSDGSFSALSFSQSGSNAIVTHAGGTITLIGVTASALTSADFNFAV